MSHLKIVAMGGGTGLSTLLKGLKLFSDVEITAVVTVTDEGGSSGVIREELGVLPPGDVRNNIVALAENESLMAEIMDYRFNEGQTFKNHSLGNLIIAALTKITGSFATAIEKISDTLAIRGVVLPVTEDAIRLVASMENGEEVVGETEIVKENSKIVNMRLDTEAHPFPKVIDAILKCDVIVLGPGSLYTSIIPNLIVNGVKEAMEGKPTILIANLMTQPGETNGFSLKDHIKTVEKYLGHPLNRVISNSEIIADNILQRYRNEGSEQVLTIEGDDEKIVSFPMIKIEVDSGDGKEKVRHDPLKLSAAVWKVAKELIGD